jgi:hypothetical protein
MSEREDPEFEMRVSAFGLAEDALDALFDRVAEAAHALDESVMCSGWLTPSACERTFTPAELRDHDDRIRAEAIKSAADNLPLSGKGQQYAGAAAWLYRRAALRAAAGTPTRHNQKEENMSETAQVCDHPGIEHGAWSYTWPCPRCGVCRFIGHGPLCGKCYHETAPVPPVAEGKA